MFNVSYHYRDQVNQFCMSGAMNEEASKKFTLTSGQISLPARVVAPKFVKRMSNPIRAALAARGLVPLQLEGVATTLVPTFADGANLASIISEDATGEVAADPVVQKHVLSAPLWASGIVWLSNNVLAARATNLMEYLEPMLEERIDAKQAAQWVGTLATNGVVGVTTASTTGLTYSDVVAWQKAIPLGERRYGALIVSDDLKTLLRAISTPAGAPIFIDSINDETPDRCLGWPTFVSPSLQSPAAGATSGIAVSAASLIVRDQGQRLQRYDSKSSHPDQTGHQLFANDDFSYEPNGVRTLRHAAT